MSSNRFSLRDRRIVVTGASRGLGRGVAAGLLEEGAIVVGVARNEADLVEAGGQFAQLPGTFIPVAADLSDANSLQSVIERAWSHGNVDGIVHMAGLQIRKPALDISPADWDRLAAIQSKAPFFLSTALARKQIEAGVAGSHLMIGSLSSWIGLPNVAPYVAAKSGILGQTRAFALEWAQANIRVNCISPGYFHTDLTKDLLADPERQSRVLSRIPMSRLGVAEDLTGAVIFLLSDASAYITGQNITVDGGWLAA